MDVSSYEDVRLPTYALISGGLALLILALLAGLVALLRDVRQVRDALANRGRPPD
jgi:hypothetical protein